jgi:hypothetical protein
VGYVADKVALGQVSVRVLGFYPVSIIPSCLSMHTDHLEQQQQLPDMDNNNNNKVACSKPEVCYGL